MPTPEDSIVDCDVWRNLNARELAKQYSPSSCVDNFDELIEEYRTESQSSESRALVEKDLKYGTGSDELLDYFPSRNGDSALYVYIHGGYWQELSKDVSTFAGAGFVENDCGYAAIGYTLAPAADIARMMEQCRNSIRWLYDQSSRLGFDRERIYLCGSSAGAHLACMAALSDWEQHGFSTSPIKGLVLMSGVYDLRPLCATYVNDPLSMNEEDARQLSPLFMDLRGLPPAIVTWGEHETAEFKRQSQALASKLLQSGRGVTSFELPNYNHFNIVHALADVRTRLGREVFALRLKRLTRNVKRF